MRSLLLAPVVVPQALWVAARAARLPEAGGDRTGENGSGRLVRLLVLGDSSAAGVGVQHQSEALGGQLATEMAKRHLIQWRVMAKSGGTVRSTIRLLDTLAPDSFDVALIALGVNDAKNGVRQQTWSKGYRQLLGTLADRFGVQTICISGLPPVRHFPILPRPLNSVLGDRAELFDRDLRQIAGEREDTIYLPLDFTLNTTQMAEDGFHPGADIYREWACRAADAFKKAGY